MTDLEMEKLQRALSETEKAGEEIRRLNARLVEENAALRKRLEAAVPVQPVPCGLCGAPGKLVDDAVRCIDCKIQGPAASSEKEAVEKWNNLMGVLGKLRDLTQPAPTTWWPGPLGFL